MSKPTPTNAPRSITEPTLPGMTTPTPIERWDSWREYIAGGGTASWPRDAFEALVEDYEDRLAAAQAKIDRLMLEYCPEEMTKAQIENWAAHQKAVEGE